MKKRGGERQGGEEAKEDPPSAQHSGKISSVLRPPPLPPRAPPPEGLSASRRATHRQWASHLAHFLLHFLLFTRTKILLFGIYQLVEECDGMNTSLFVIRSSGNHRLVTERASGPREEAWPLCSPLCNIRIEAPPLGQGSEVLRRLAVSLVIAGFSLIARPLCFDRHVSPRCLSPTPCNVHLLVRV